MKSAPHSSLRTGPRSGWTRRSLAILALCILSLAPSNSGAILISRWTDHTLNELLAVARAAPADGLPVEDGLIADLEAARARPGADAATAADRLFERVATNLAVGRVDPKTVDPDWLLSPPEKPDIAQLRRQALAFASPAKALSGLAPTTREYGLLKSELAKVRKEAAGALDASGVTREERIGKLRAAMERWRWTPRMPADRIEVHVPEYHLVLIQNDSVMRTQAVVVGKANTPTPAMSAQIVSVTLNPYWEPPASILLGELAPRFAKDPGAATRDGFEAVDASGAVLSPDAVPWSKRPFPYRVRQRPGPGNALGALRFNMPNPEAIFLHDTPSKGLFAQETRSFSHGCIRVENPFDLAAVLLGADWSRDRIEAKQADGISIAIPFAKPMPIFLLYLTAARGADDSIVYVKDVYRRDPALLRALDAPLPETAP